MTQPAGGGARFAVLAATLFGAGRAPIAPGTFGTLAALLPAVPLALTLPPWAFAAATLVLSVVAIVTADVAARVLGHKDPKPVVIDEAAGLFVTLLYLPPVPAVFALAFLLFRAMDVIKPPPARRAEGLPGGWGIVVDDLIAGVYANLAIRVVLALVPSRSAA